MVAIPRTTKTANKERKNVMSDLVKIIKDKKQMLQKAKLELNAIRELQNSSECDSYELNMKYNWLEVGIYQCANYISKLQNLVPK